MRDILVHLRAMHLFAHNAHNLVARAPFHSDHAFFGETYEALSDAYDSVAERIIGLMGEEALKPQTLLLEVGEKLKMAPSTGVKENKVFYQFQLMMEQELCKKISMTIAAGVSPGTEQMLGDLCDKSEVRQYKIKQRIK
jgi:DNA-binding ferritin-like protein